MTTGLFWLRPAGGGRSLRCGVLVLLWAAACTGPRVNPSSAWNSDMLVFASGSDEISDALRSVQQALRTDSTWGKATLRIALVNRSGTVVWFCGSTAAGGDIDLRSAAGAMTLAGRVFADLPPR